MLSIRTEVVVNSSFGPLDFITFNNIKDNKEHLAIGVGPWKNKIELNVRMHSECLTSEVFSSMMCDCKKQLEDFFIENKKSGGILLYLRQEGRGIGLYNKLDSYSLQRKGLDTVEANQFLGFEDDLRDYKIAYEILNLLNINSIFLHTNNPNKYNQLKELGVNIIKIIPTKVHENVFNREYLITKKIKSKHLIDIRMINDKA